MPATGECPESDPKNKSRLRDEINEDYDSAINSWRRSSTMTTCLPNTHPIHSAVLELKKTGDRCVAIQERPQSFLVAHGTTGQDKNEATK
jgi:hypothetical protein